MGHRTSACADVAHRVGGTSNTSGARARGCSRSSLRSDVIVRGASRALGSDGTGVVSKSYSGPLTGRTLGARAPEYSRSAKPSDAVPSFTLEAPGVVITKCSAYVVRSGIGPSIVSTLGACPLGSGGASYSGNAIARSAPGAFSVGAGRFVAGSIGEASSARSAHFATDILIHRTRCVGVARGHRTIACADVAHRVGGTSNTRGARARGCSRSTNRSHVGVSGALQAPVRVLLNTWTDGLLDSTSPGGITQTPYLLTMPIFVLLVVLLVVFLFTHLSLY